MIKIGVDYYPEQWDRTMWEKDAAAMETLGVQTVRIAEFSWCRMEPQDGEFDFVWLDEVIQILNAHHLEVILGTPTNCPPMWLYHDHPDTLQCERDGRRTYPGIRGHRCMTSRTFRSYAARIIRKMAERYAGRPGIAAWQIDNELESNHCTCPECAQSFRQWLQKKYSTLEQLNKAWGSVTWSQEISDWEQITPLKTSAVNRTDWFNPGYMLDYERFCTWSLSDYVRFQCDIIRGIDPKAVITTNACFPKDLPDFHQEFAALDVASYDNYPTVEIPEDPESLYTNAFALDFVRSFKQKNFWILEQLGGPMGCWRPITRALEPGMLEGYGLQAVAHGADLLSFFRWRTAVSGAEMFCYGLLNHDNQPNRRTEELKELISRLAKMPQLSETTLNSRTAMLYSADQEFSFHTQAQSEGFAYWTQLRLFHEACINLGVNIDILPEGHSLDGYQVLIVPTWFVTDKKIVKQIENFAAGGGTVIITNRSGVKDKTGSCILGDPLPTLFRPLCGCRVNDTDAIGPSWQRIRSIHGGEFRITSWCDLLELETAEPLAKYTDRFYAGTPAITVNHYGSGLVYYVGTVGEKAMYRWLLLEIFHSQGIKVMELLPEGIESTVRSGPGGSYRFFFNNTLQGKSFYVEGRKIWMQAMEVKIRKDTGEWI